jgi:hypothetical protein
VAPVSYGIMSMIFMAKKSLTPITSAEMVIWAVSLLGGDQKRIDTEDVAVKAFQLAPKSFCWRKYPKQINLELVRVNLSNAKKPENGELLAGSGRTGWSLTRKGLAWIRSARSRLQAQGMGEPQRRESRAGSIDSSRRDRERKRILALPAWTRWTSGDKSVVPAEAHEVYRLDSYSTATVREAKLTRLRAMFGDDEQLSSFLAHLSDVLDKEDKEDDPSQ